MSHSIFLLYPINQEGWRLTHAFSDLWSQPNISFELLHMLHYRVYGGAICASAHRCLQLAWATLIDRAKTVMPSLPPWEISQFCSPGFQPWPDSGIIRIKTCHLLATVQMLFCWSQYSIFLSQFNSMLLNKTIKLLNHNNLPDEIHIFNLESLGYSDFPNTVCSWRFRCQRQSLDFTDFTKMKCFS